MLYALARSCTRFFGHSGIALESLLWESKYVCLSLGFSWLSKSTPKRYEQIFANMFLAYNRWTHAARLPVETYLPFPMLSTEKAMDVRGWLLTNGVPTWFVGSLLRELAALGSE